MEFFTKTKILTSFFVGLRFTFHNYQPLFFILRYAWTCIRLSAFYQIVTMIGIPLVLMKGDKSISDIFNVCKPRGDYGPIYPDEAWTSELYN